MHSVNNQYSYYLLNNNVLFDGRCLVVCYSTSEKETIDNSLTGNNILVFLKSPFLKTIPIDENVDFPELIQNMFESHKEIFLRVQSECMLGLYGDSHCDCEVQRLNAIALIKSNQGIYFHLPQEAQGLGLPYKLSELELQVSGRNQHGEFVGIKNRDEAFELIKGAESKFTDNRSYQIVAKILRDLQLDKFHFSLITNSKPKMELLIANDISGSIYEMKSVIDTDNLSEYLIKIAVGNHSYDDSTLTSICDLIAKRKLSDRAIETFARIVKQINDKEMQSLSNKWQKLFLNLYDEMFYGSELQYAFLNRKVTVTQHKFSCKVNSKIFAVLCEIYQKNIFCRIASEFQYLFHNNHTDETIKVRTSKVLETSVTTGQNNIKDYHFARLTVYSNDRKRGVVTETSISELKSFFENKHLDYLRKVEMITFVSENMIDEDISIYVKRIPKIGSRILDIFGKKSTIQNLISKIFEVDKNTILGIASDPKMENEEYSAFSLRFSNLQSSIEEEVNIFNALSKNYNKKIL